MLVSLCEHGTEQMVDHHTDLLAKEMKCMKILQIYYYNDDDNDLMTRKEQRTQIFFSL